MKTIINEHGNKEIQFYNNKKIQQLHRDHAPVTMYKRYIRIIYYGIDFLNRF